MRELLLRAAGSMTALAALTLLGCVLVRESRVARRRTIEVLLADTSGGPRARPRSRRTRRALVLELADRLHGTSLTEQVPWVAEVRRQAVLDLTSRRWVRRARGLRTLHPLGLDDAVLRGALGDRDPRVRALAAGLARGRTEPQLLARLVTLLDDPTPVVRHATLDALTRRGPGSAQALHEALLAAVVLTAQDLSGRDSRAAQHDLVAALAAQTVGVREASAPGPAHTETVAPGLVVVSVPSGRAGSAGTLPRPLRSSAVPADGTRTLLLVLQACGASADEELLGPTRRFLIDARPEVRAAAVRTLASLGESADALVPALSDVDGRVRTEAVAALGRLGARSLAGRLAHALSDRDHAVRGAAAGALVRLDGAGRLLLQRAMRGTDRFAADAARVALGLPPVAEVVVAVTAEAPDGPSDQGPDRGPDQMALPGARHLPEHVR